MKYFRAILMTLAVMYSSFSYANCSKEVRCVNGSGACLSTWEANTGFDVEIHVSSIDVLGSLSPTLTLTDPKVCINSRKPMPAIDSAGNCAVVWVALDPALSIERLYGSMLVLGTWTVPTPISDITEVIMNDNFNVGIISGAVKVTWSSINLLTYNTAIRAMYNPMFGTWSGIITNVAL